MTSNSPTDNGMFPESSESQTARLMAFYKPQRVIAYIEGKDAHPKKTVLGDMVTGASAEHNEIEDRKIINVNTKFQSFEEVTSLQNEIDELDAYMASSQGMSIAHRGLLRDVIEAKRRMIERLRPDYTASSFPEQYNQAHTRFIISEYFRDAVARGLEESNPNIIPYRLRIDPPHEINNNNNKSPILGGLITRKDSY